MKFKCDECRHCVIKSKLFHLCIDVSDGQTKKNEKWEFRISECQCLLLALELQLTLMVSIGGFLGVHSV